MEPTTGAQLADRTAIVTGGGHGIGAAYVRRFADAGARVVVAELDGAAGEQVASEVRGRGQEAIAVTTDVADEESTRELARRTLEVFDRIDILVNNAAVFATIPISRAGFEDISIDEWDLVMRVNLRGTWLPCRAVAPAMRQQGYGKIVNISSDTAFKPTPGRSHYVASKAGIGGLTRTLATELGPDGIRVNCIAPGKTLSAEDADEATLRAHQTVAASQVLPGVMRSEDMTGAVLFLAGPDSDFITGQTLLVNGGATMH
jgi:3-oxoacyl-[acyl-carrier protein] reductase